ncbi:MAG: site-specific recombinase [Rhodocyclaceae bacterium]|nr:site-specific recombinase [Rhodocyclaceae bacterium]MBX3669789.1 site-specific recombinase [Rhodocyclaceae bacterium]
MEYILDQFAQLPDAEDPLPLFVQLAARLRPRRAHDTAQAELNLKLLCGLLAERATWRHALRRALFALIGRRRQVTLYAERGILPGTGFFSELSRRLSCKLLPEALQPEQLRDTLGIVFARHSDWIWVKAVSDDSWKKLLAALRFDEQDGRPTEVARSLGELLEAIQVLSYRIAAMGLEPELLRIEPSVEKFESPFLMQNVEVRQFLEGYKQWLADAQHAGDDHRHVMVLLDQCRSILARVRRTAAQEGTSVSLTFLAVRLRQNIRRMETLLQLLGDYRAAPSGTDFYGHVVALFKHLVESQNKHNDVSGHVHRNLNLIALRVTDNASRTGEHYIASDRAEYFALARSGLGAGLIVGFMAMLKVVIAAQHFAPLSEALLFSLNYSLGFMLIHLLNFTVATKQPAMTAATIAASIQDSEDNRRNLDNLVNLTAATVRGQIVAILGNIALAIPTAMAIAWAWAHLAGLAFVEPAKAHGMLADIHPTASAAVIYAGLAGICLFLSGIVAGYYDNKAVYDQIPQRIRQLRAARWLLGEARLARVAEYVRNHLGALAGNFYFGLMLGGVTAMGVLFGLPIDIRHITFSSAYFGFAVVAQGFQLAPGEIFAACLGIAAIGCANLAVSFSLALWLAMRAREVGFAQRGQFFKNLLRRMLASPRDFFLPPRRNTEVAEQRAGG